MQECRERAFSHNPALTLAEDDHAIARARANVSATALFPAVSAKAEESSGRAEQSNETPAFVQRSYGFQATQTLFAGGKLHMTQRQALIAVEIARLQLEKQRHDVQHAVTESYWRVAGLQLALKAHDDAHELIQEVLIKAARHDLSDARSARIELLSTRARHRENIVARAELEESLLTARQALWDAMGERSEPRFDVATEIPVDAVEVDAAEALRLARTHRWELRMAELAVDSAELSRSIGRSGFYPKIDLNGFFGRSASAFTETEPLVYRRDWNVGLTAQWAILGNSLRYATHREKTSPRLGESSRTESRTRSLSFALGDALGVGVAAKESLRTYHEERWRYERTLREIDNEVRASLHRLTSARARVDAAEATLEASLQELKSTRSLLAEDRAHLGDLAAAHYRLASSQSTLAQARAHYRGTISALNRAVGLIDRFRAGP